MTGKPPVVYLLAGLQGAGKTTTAGKLAKYLQERHKKKVMLVSADVYRLRQLSSLSKSLSKSKPILCHQVLTKIRLISPNAPSKLPSTVSRYFDYRYRRSSAHRRSHDGRNQSLNRSGPPSETLFVVDSMTGQDAANTAKAFNDALPLTGVILTKTDGDARGGAALSVRAITGKPIKFLGRGEKLDALEPFHPERVARRILGMGDVLSLWSKKSSKKLTAKKRKKWQKNPKRRRV
ncbi:MAG: zeta toxin family protein [Moraxella sp.]